MKRDENQAEGKCVSRFTCCFYLFIDFDKKSASRTRHENFKIPITLYISMSCSLSMIFTL